MRTERERRSPFQINRSSIRLKQIVAGVAAVFLAQSLFLQIASARLYDNFSTITNWTLSGNGGSAAIQTNVLTLTSPNGALSTPTAKLKSEQVLTGSRQSILVEAHTGLMASTAFFLWAIDPATSNKLELKLDDVGPTIVVAGYYTNDVYHFAGSAAYSPGTDGLYMGFRETNGMTYWETSTNASTWTEVASASDPVATSAMTFEVQHKAYEVTSGPTYTDVGCFNYKLRGMGYHSLDDKTNSGGEGWELYTEGFFNSNLVCSSQGPASPCGMKVNGVDSTQHFKDISIPAPYTNQMGYDFQIISTEEPTTRDYYNAYRYQELPFVDADRWTYHLYFKYTYPQFITQGFEFPLNKYTGTNRLQAAFAWYPLRNGTDNGQWYVWAGSQGWRPTGQDQSLQTNFWYEVTFTAGLHDNQVFYNGFQAGDVWHLVSFSWNQTYSAPRDRTLASIVPAVQIDDNAQDTTTEDTRKDCYMAEWEIDWMYERLP
jgi:hypothetical protein